MSASIMHAVTQQRLATAARLRSCLASYASLCPSRPAWRFARTAPSPAPHSRPLFTATLSLCASKRARAAKRAAAAAAKRAKLVMQPEAPPAAASSSTAAAADSSGVRFPSVGVQQATHRVAEKPLDTEHVAASSPSTSGLAGTPTPAAASKQQPQAVTPPSPPSNRSPQQPQQQQQQQQRRYALAASATGDASLVQQLRRELVQVRLQLATAQHTHTHAYETILAQLAENDRAAHRTATSLRYTGMALRCAHDNLEVELRRLLAIGLTAAEVDAAAVEAGARAYVRQNIGFNPQHVSTAPPSITDVSKATEAATQQRKARDDD